jgi:lipopolysaccharide export system protein LptA|tara:strand:- start:2857 stop:3285 length:429 start_codon:yes stop_codon:yes gene_type:complete
MAKHTFKMSDVTGDTRLLARSALGYDFNYFADDETLIFGTGSDATIAWDGDSLEVTSADTNFSAGVTLTTGDMTVTAGDAHVVAQNLYLGAETAFATTEPTSAIIIKQGTAFAGAIVTSSAIQANATVLRKVIADGTISNVG